MALSSGLSSFDLVLPAPPLALAARLSVPPAASGLVVFVHGSGSNRLSPRNLAVAEVLQQGGLATLLFDLHAAQGPSGNDEPPDDPMLLCQRLLQVLRHLRRDSASGAVAGVDVSSLPLGLFGASSGAAVALAAAAEQPELVGAIVSRGGRPDLVVGALGGVRAPTLLLVGSLDVDVLELNCWASAQLQCRHELRVVPGAGHLFAEPGALDCVARWSRQWFLEHLRT